MPDGVEYSEDGFETAEGVAGEMIERVGAGVGDGAPRDVETGGGVGGGAGCARDVSDGVPLIDRRGVGGGVPAGGGDLVGRQAREPVDGSDQPPQVRLA